MAKTSKKSIAILLICMLVAALGLTGCSGNEDGGDAEMVKIGYVAVLIIVQPDCSIGIVHSSSDYLFHFFTPRNEILQRSRYLHGNTLFLF